MALSVVLLVGSDPKPPGNRLGDVSQLALMIWLSELCAMWFRCPSSRALLARRAPRPSCGEFVPIAAPHALLASLLLALRPDRQGPSRAKKLREFRVLAHAHGGRAVR
jgi:hypothetical protein